MYHKIMAEEMYAIIESELRKYKPLLRKICIYKEIDAEYYVDVIPESDAFSTIDIMMMQTEDNIDRIFYYSSDEKRKLFCSIMLREIGYRFFEKASYLKKIHDEISIVKDEQEVHPFLNLYDKKIIDTIYGLTTNVDESDIETNLEKIADIITSIECTGVNMESLCYCVHIRDIVYMKKASRVLYFRIKDKMDKFPEVNDFKWFEFNGDEMNIVDADNIQDILSEWDFFGKRNYDDGLWKEAPYK